MELPIRIDPMRVGRSNKMTSRGILGDYIFRILPRVKKLLYGWEMEARRIPDPVLKTQALDSLTLKAFHCQGGAVFAVPWSRTRKELLEFIVAYQTLCDYLDNLCDRVGSTDGQAFRQLHRSLFDALHPQMHLNDYYKYYPLNNDDGYINKLVKTCQDRLGAMPGYALIQKQTMLLAELYSELQVRKHLGLEVRHEELSGWARVKSDEFEDLLWPEYAAACGSTLAIFALLRSAGEPDSMSGDEMMRIREAYFPWICGLHILLDYFIDRAEDRLGGDLNFTFYYDSDQFMQNRLEVFTRQSLLCADKLPQAVFHRMVVKGLLAMYLSDKKVAEQGFCNTAGFLLDAAGPGAWRTYHVCRKVRRFL
ncbi:MAG: tetraprenyl-beta-curcumene synthase family protein [Deltaproteobacteria bacterium]